MCASKKNNCLVSHLGFAYKNLIELLFSISKTVTITYIIYTIYTMYTVIYIYLK